MKKRLTNVLASAFLALSCVGGSFAYGAEGGINGLNEPPTEGSTEHGIIGLQENYGVLYTTELSELGGNAEADTAACIIDGSYSSDTVNRSCTIREMKHDLLIDAGDEDITVLLDELTLDNTIRVKADKGSVAFFVKGSLTCGGNSCGIVWHELRDSSIVAYYQRIPVTFNSSEGAEIVLKDKSTICGCFRTPRADLDIQSEGAFTVEYISEQGEGFDRVYRIRPSIIGSGLFSKVRDNGQNFMAYCSESSRDDDGIRYGDANCDGCLDLADAIFIMQALANPNRYEMSQQGRTNADTDSNGVTVDDALAIQLHLLKVR